MDYEKKYNDALIAVKKLQEANPNDEGIQNWIDDSFPELKESEDEKIRKYFCKDIWTFIPNEKAHKYIAWLEKRDKESSWKPSRAQISALEHFVRSIEESGYASPYDSNTKLLNSLINDLYKLEKQGEPDGKRAERIDGVLTLVDEPKVDNRPVTERIKTFEDACNELSRMAEKGYETAADLLADYESNSNNILVTQTLATMKLSIIAYALNEGWEPKFTEDEYRYFPSFYLYTRGQYDELDDEGKRHCVLRSGVSTSLCFVYCSSCYDASFSGTHSGSRLAFRTRELADYAGRQFTNEWADFMFQK